LLFAPLHQINRMSYTDSVMTVSRRQATDSDRDLVRPIHHRAYRKVIERQYGVWDLAAQDQFFDAAWCAASTKLFCAMVFYRYSASAHEDFQNGPIFSADKVQTPVMIIQGDIDYVSIGQGEEFFMALYRQGKRARFVRYWGEGHGIDSPANIRDEWEQIFGWLDEHLKKDIRTGIK
jgi:acetyl esterase/lipase